MNCPVYVNDERVHALAARIYAIRDVRLQKLFDDVTYTTYMTSFTDKICGWKPNGAIHYSNATVTSSESAPQAQRIAACSVFVGCSLRKLRAFKVLDINALVHYTSAWHVRDQQG